MGGQQNLLGVTNFVDPHYIHDTPSSDINDERSLITQNSLMKKSESFGGLTFRISLNTLDEPNSMVHH